MSNAVGFTVQFNNMYNCRFQARTFAVLADALKWGFATTEAFGVSNEAGAMVWVWEMRT